MPVTVFPVIEELKVLYGFLKIIIFEYGRIGNGIYMQSCNVSQCDADALPSLTKCHTPRREPETQKKYFDSLDAEV